MNIEAFCAKESCSIKQAFELIEENEHGTLVITNNAEEVVGVATDGDIRRWLMRGNSIEDAIGSCYNHDFISVSEDDKREKVLKLLDDRIRVLPVLTPEGRLKTIYTRSHFPLSPEDRVYAHAKSPVRISFGGGGTDLTYYFVENGGAVINSTISIFSHAVLRKRSDNEIHIYSSDLQANLRAESLAGMAQANAEQGGRFDLFANLLKVLEPNFGFDLFVDSEFPIGSGLGGSAVVMSAVIGCFNHFREDRWDNYEIAEIAFQAERLQMSVAGGWQDQYATVFGGCNYMEFASDKNIIHPLRLQTDTLRQLEASLLLCHTGASHHSGNIHREQKKKVQSDESVQKYIDANKRLTLDMKNALLKGQLGDFGRMLDEMWQQKKSFGYNVSNNHLNEIYELAIENGALGGKILGAGGGGYFLFFVPSFAKFNVVSALRKVGLEVRQFTFDQEGLQCWANRELRIT